MLFIQKLKQQLRPLFLYMTENKHLFSILAIVSVLLVIFAVKQQFGVTRDDVSAEQETQMEAAIACNTLLTVEDFLRACPSASTKQRLRVDAEMFYFPKLYKCSMNVSALGATSLYIVADAFKDEKSAQSRMKERMTEGYTEASGNVLGLGEEGSAFNMIRNSPEVLLQKDHVYIEVAPTGGGLCPGSELINLGRHFYERMLQLPPYHP